MYIIKTNTLNHWSLGEPLHRRCQRLLLSRGCRTWHGRWLAHDSVQGLRIVFHSNVAVPGKHLPRDVPGNVRDGLVTSQLFQQVRDSESCHRPVRNRNFGHWRRLARHHWYNTESADEPSSTTKRLVFVSHGGPDTWVAKQIAREIEARGATPFLDEAQVDAGADFGEDILDFLQRAHELVVLLTPWRWNGLTFGPRSGPRGAAEFRSWHYCSGSRRRSCKFVRAYLCCSRSAIFLS